MAKKKEKKKPIFEKVGLVFRSPVRADIMRQLSVRAQKPIDLAENIGIQKQNLNYHLNALKKGGLIKTHREEFSRRELQTGRGAKINGVTTKGKVIVSHGVELTPKGKDIVNQFIDPLYEKESSDQKGKGINHKLEDE